MKNYCTNDIIFAPATPWAKSAIALIRVSGEGCIKQFAPHFKCKCGLESHSSSAAVFGHLDDIDQCVVTLYRDGHGYTGEEAFEISCHGGLEIVKSILILLQSLGFRKAEGGEFTLRAFLNGKMDLTRAEAVNELINSRGKTGARLALSRLNGALFERIDEIKNVLVDMLSVIEVQLDYAEDEIDQDLTFPTDKLDKAINLINKISSSYSTGRLYSEGARIVLSGAVNAGKSSLFNMFLKEERAIVSDIEGTTRDFIEESCTIDGIPVRLFDTAGLRESSDAIEKEGIVRSQTLIESADLILYLVDATNAVFDNKILSDPRTICVINKTDLAHPSYNPIYKDAVYVSVKTGDGFENLCNAISKALKKDVSVDDDSTAVIESQRQLCQLNEAETCLNNAKTHLDEGLPLDIITMDIQEAVQDLGEITGDVTTDDILDRIFSNFCVGK